MKRGKNLLLLVLVLAVLLGATYGINQLNLETASADEEEAVQTTVFTLDTDSVTAISWDYSEAVSFEKQDDAWVYTEDDAFTVDETYIDAMLEALAEITSSKTIENVEDWDAYGLEIPVCAITVTAGDTYSVNIGEASAVDGLRYLSIGDGNAYLVDASILTAFSYGLYDVLDYESIPDMSYLYTMEVTSSVQDYTIVYQSDSGLAYSDEYVWFMDSLALDNDLAETLLDTVVSLSWVECVNFHADDLSEYGLDDPAVIATVYYTEVVQVATNETDEDGNTVYDTQATDKTFTLEIGDATGDYRYARIAGSSMIYKIDGDIADALMYTTYYELQPDEVLLMDWDTVTSLEITLDDVVYQFTHDTIAATDDDGNETTEDIFLLNGEQVDLDTVTGCLDNMTSTGYANGLTPERSQEIQILIYREDDNFPEVEIAFYQYDSSSCLTTLNGSATLFVSRESVVDLVEAVNQVVLS